MRRGFGSYDESGVPMLFHFRIRFLLLFAMAAAAWGQDCVVSFSLAAAGSSAQFDNRNRGCTTWAITYNSTGFTALSLAFESAPNASGVPGAWVNFAGTITSGINPNTAITQNTSAFDGYFPFIRATLSGLVGSGTVTGIYYGWRSQPAPVGGLTEPVDVQGVDANGAAVTGKPVQVGGVDGGGLVRRLLTSTGGHLTNRPASTSTAMADDLSNTQPIPSGEDSGATSPVQRVFPFVYDGSTWDRQAKCVTSAAITLTGSGNTQIIAAPGAGQLRICHISLGFASAVGVKLTNGTGANCGTGTADVTGVYQNITGLALDFVAGPLLVPTTNALCVNLSAAVNGGGVVSYVAY